MAHLRLRMAHLCLQLVHLCLRMARLRLRMVHSRLRMARLYLWMIQSQYIKRLTRFPLRTILNTRRLQQSNMVYQTIRRT